LRNKDAWMPAQRAALQDLSYGTLRYFGRLQAILKTLLHKSPPDERVQFLLLVALYQLLYANPRNMPWSIMRCELHKH
jgi:hypothetical protein